METALLLEATSIGIAAPIGGVCFGSDKSALRALAFVSGAVLAATVAMVTIISTEAVPAAGASQLMLAAAALALAALGSCFRLAFRDILDATACSVGLALVLTFGILAIGPPAGNLPTPLVNAALAASPIVAATSAANIDIFRSEPLYRLSPIAHRQFDYPSWPSTSLLYAATALGGFLLASHRHRTSPRPDTSTSPQQERL